MFFVQKNIEFTTLFIKNTFIKIIKKFSVKLVNKILTINFAS